MTHSSKAEVLSQEIEKVFLHKHSITYQFGMLVDFSTIYLPSQ